MSATLTPVQSTHEASSAPGVERRGLVWQRRLRRKLVTLDLVAGLVAATGTVLLRYDGNPALLRGVDYRWLAVVTGLAWVAVVAASGGYDRRVIGLGSEEFRRVGNAAVRILALLVLAGFVFKADVSRTVVIVSVVSMCLLTLLLRWVARRVLHRERRRGRCMHRVVAVGTSAEVRSLITSLGRAPHAGLVVIAACVSDGDD